MGAPFTSIKGENLIKDICQLRILTIYHTFRIENIMHCSVL